MEFGLGGTAWRSELDASSTRTSKALEVLVDEEELAVLLDVTVRYGNDCQGRRKAAQIRDHDGAPCRLSPACVELVQGLEVGAQLG